MRLSTLAGPVRVLARRPVPQGTLDSSHTVTRFARGRLLGIVAVGKLADLVVLGGGLTISPSAKPFQSGHKMRFTTMHTTAAALTLSMALPAVLHSQAPPLSNPELDSLITERMADAAVTGVGAAIIVNRQVVWTNGYGFMDLARTRPFTTSTIMNIASITKTFTGVAMMRAVQDGRLSLCAETRGGSTQNVRQGRWSAGVGLGGAMIRCTKRRWAAQ